MLDIELNKTLPIIKMNFSEVKASIEEAMKKYDGLVVTEEELAGCKSTQKQLAGYRTKLDTYRKSVKKEMTKPIKDFENECNTLIDLVKQAEDPIKEGIEVFNQKRRDEKRIEAEEIIVENIEEYKLNDKYMLQLTVLDKYTMLSSKPKDVKTDIEQRAFILSQDQIREIEAIKLEEEHRVEALRLETERKAELAALEEKRQIELKAAEDKRKKEFEESEALRKTENLEIAKDTLVQANLSINSKMIIDDFVGLVESGATAMNIIQEINKRKDRIVISETPKVEKKIEPIVESIKEFKKELETPKQKIEPEKIYWLKIRVEGSLEKVKDLSAFLNVNGYKYFIGEKGIVK